LPLIGQNLCSYLMAMLQIYKTTKRSEYKKSAKLVDEKLAEIKKVQNAKEAELQRLVDELEAKTLSVPKEDAFYKVKFY